MKIRNFLHSFGLARFIGIAVGTAAFSGILGVNARGDESRQQTPAIAKEAQAVAPAAKTPPHVGIDEGAMALLKKSADATFKLRTFCAESWTTLTYGADANGKTKSPMYYFASIVAEKPKHSRYEQWEMTAGADRKNTNQWTRKDSMPKYKSVCDGKTIWNESDSRYSIEKCVDADFVDEGNEPWMGMFQREDSPGEATAYAIKVGDVIELRHDGKEAVDGVPCDKIYLHTATVYKGETLETEETYFIGPDALMRRKVNLIRSGSQPTRTFDAVVRNIIVNRPIAAVDRAHLFSFPAPKGIQFKSDDADEAAAPAPVAAKVAAPAVTESAPVKMAAKLRVGDAAPDFKGIDRDGKPIKLSDLRGKVVVLDFWASWCEPCKASMPHNQEVIQKMQAENVPVVFLAINDDETLPVFSAWVKTHPQYYALHFVFVDPAKNRISESLYAVSAIPAQFVIDANGIVRAASVGYRGPDEKLGNAIRAALQPPITR